MHVRSQAGGYADAPGKDGVDPDEIARFSTKSASQAERWREVRHPPGASRHSRARGGNWLQESCGPTWGPVEQEDRGKEK